MASVTVHKTQCILFTIFLTVVCLHVSNGASTNKPATKDIELPNKLLDDLPTEEGHQDHVPFEHVSDNSSDGGHSDNKSSHGGHGIHVIGWRWDYVREPLIITVFLIVTAICKLGFHNAGVLPNIFPESCLLILLGTAVGGILYVIQIFVCKGDDQFRIILESAYSLHDRVFGDNLGTILMYAVIGTLINCFVLGPCLYGLAIAGAMGPISISLVQCLVFSALIVAVDPVAVLAIFQEIGVNNVLYFLVFGESLLNDAVTVVLYNMMTAFNEMDQVPVSQIFMAVASFFTISLGGLGIGIIYGCLTALMTKCTEHVRVIEPLAIFAFAYGSYITAELFHFSGIISIIGCGLVQAQYAFHNISHKSSTTVLYFSKVLSTTCDCIIFMFLGLALVTDTHVWHTGFVLWTIVLTLAIRFVGVYALTFFANKCFRMREIDYEEQFIMAYGGLRGAVAFSLVAMLNRETVPHQRMFETTTLAVIIFTVFIQGITIKPLVKLLRIKTAESKVVSMYDEINKHVTDHLMAGVEEIIGYHGHNTFREFYDYYDDKYLKHLFQRKPQTKDDHIMELYQQIAMQEHIDNLAGAADLDRFSSQMQLYKCEYSLDEAGHSFAEIVHPDLADRTMDYEIQRRRSVTSDTSLGLPHGFHNRRLAMPRLKYGVERNSDPGPDIPLTQDPEAPRSSGNLPTSSNDDVTVEEPSVANLRKWLVKNPSRSGYHQKHDRNLRMSDNNDLIHHLQEKRRRSLRYLRSISYYSPSSSVNTSPIGSDENLDSTRLSQLETITEGKLTNGNRPTLSEQARYSGMHRPVQMRRRSRMNRPLTVDDSVRGSDPQTKHSPPIQGSNGRHLDRALSVDAATSESPLLAPLQEGLKGDVSDVTNVPSDRDSNSSDDTPAGKSKRALLARQRKVRDISPPRREFAGKDQNDTPGITFPGRTSIGETSI